LLDALVFLGLTKNYDHPESSGIPIMSRSDDVKLLRWVVYVTT